MPGKIAHDKAFLILGYVSHESVALTLAKQIEQG